MVLVKGGGLKAPCRRPPRLRATWQRQGLRGRSLLNRNNFRDMSFTRRLRGSGTRPLRKIAGRRPINAPRASRSARPSEPFGLLQRRAEGVVVAMTAESERGRLHGIRNERERLIEQIRQSELTIEHSRKLLKRIDELLAKAEKKP